MMLVMQTFLPYSNFAQSAKALDRQRLGKQRVEAWQILKTLTEGGGWENHPAVKMWKGFETALAHYGAAMCVEWRIRNYNDNMYQRFSSYLDKEVDLPPWLGNKDFHLAHQSNLIRKDPYHYKALFGEDVPNNLPYVWPVQKD